MRSAYRAVAVSAIVAAASFVIRADVTPPSQAAEIQLQLGDILFSEGQVPRSPRRLSQRPEGRAADDVRRPRMGVIASALRVAEFDLARTEAEKLVKSAPGGPEAMALYGDALWAMRAVRGSRAATTRTRWRCRRSWRAAITAWPSRCRAQPARRGDERGAGGAAARRRATSRSTTPSARSTSGMHKYEEAAAAYSQLRQPAAEQGSQREGRVVARRDPLPALVRPARAVRDGSRRRRQDLHRRLPAGERKGHRPRQGQRRGGAGLRRRHRLGEHGHHAADGAAARHHAGHLHAQRRRRRRRPARPAAGAHRLAGARHAQAAQRAVPDQEPAAARHSGKRNREPVAAGARLLDDRSTTRRTS